MFFGDFLQVRPIIQKKIHNFSVSTLEILILVLPLQRQFVDKSIRFVDNSRLTQKQTL